MSEVSTVPAACEEVDPLISGGFTMQKPHVITAVPVVMAALLLTASPAEAGTRVPVVLVDDQVFGSETSTFTSDIPGCPTGTSTTIRGMVQDRAGVFRGTRVFTCDSGAASFTVNLSARFGEGGSVGTWSVIGSTGVLGDVHGAGTLVGTPLPGGIRDTYSGTVTVTG
jgi:hypothetical protein